MKLHRACYRCTALLLALSLLLGLTACGSKTAAATMFLKRTEGTVAVSDDAGKDVPVLEDLGLFSGYGVDTQTESYAWIDLDSVKLTKMDQNSQIAIKKEGKLLDIEIKSGALFFNVTQPLAEDETMDIRTSTMLVGIRGTCGWVEERNGASRAYLLEGKVECSAGDQTAQVNAGEMAELTADGQIVVTGFTAWDVPVFVRDEVAEDSGLAQAILEGSGIDVLDPTEPDPAADALAAYRTIVAQAASYFSDDDAYYGDMDVTISYRYALVQMQTEFQIPALILEQETYGDYWGDMYTALVFQYDPDSQTVFQAEGSLGEGVASAGGYRGDLSAAGDGYGILETSWYSGTGEGSTDRVSLSGDSLRSVTVWSGNIMSDDSSSVASAAIDWHEITDLSGLDSWTPGELPPEPETQEPEEAPLPTDGDRIVFTGTIDTYSYDEVLFLQGTSDPNAGYSDTSETFRLILLDTPQYMTLRSGDGLGSYESGVWMISVPTSRELAQYDGQHLIFSIDPGKTSWPSDTSLPLGQPHTSDLHVLGTAAGT